MLVWRKDHHHPFLCFQARHVNRPHVSLSLPILSISICLYAYIYMWLNGSSPSTFVSSFLGAGATATSTWRLVKYIYWPHTSLSIPISVDLYLLSTSITCMSELIIVLPFVSLSPDNGTTLFSYG